MKFRGGEFSTGTTGNFQPELTKPSILQLKSTFLSSPAMVDRQRGSS